jgi:hypothetical protein
MTDTPDCLSSDNGCGWEPMRFTVGVLTPSIGGPTEPLAAPRGLFSLLCFGE